MNRVTYKKIRIAAMLVPLVLLFQNCGKPFHAIQSNQASSVRAEQDTLAPSLQVTAPLNGILVPAQVDVAGGCETGLPVVMSIAGISAQTVCTDGLFNHRLALTVADGNHVLDISQTDLAGNKTSAQVDIIKDTAAPLTAITVPLASTLIGSPNLTVSGTCESGLDVMIAGSAVAAPASAACAAGLFSLTVTVTGPNGIQVLTASQTDRAGNVTVNSRNVQIDLPVGGPVIRIVAPAANSLTRAGITLTGTCVNLLPITVAGTGIVSAKTIACTAGAFSTPLTFSTGDGIKNVTVTQTNSLNLVGQDARSFTLDTTPPAPQILTPVAGAAFVSTVALGGSCETGLAVTVNGAGVTAPLTTTCAAAQFQLSVSLSAGTGAKIITVTQTDAAGNVGRHSRTFERIDPAPINGAVLYANNCAGCHQPLATSSKKNRNFTQIKSAIAGIASMNGIKLSDPEIQAVADVLFVTVPVSTTAMYTKGAYGLAPLRRLTRYEITNSLTGALALNPTPMLGNIPEDIGNTIYFDNEAGTQGISSSVIESYRTFAATYATTVASNAARVSTLAGCTPASANDRACFVKFAQKVGRRLLRRPVTPVEANHLADILLPYAVIDNRFSTSIELLVRAWVQHPEFLYRIESGTAVAGQIEINDFQIATRMSFLVWGEGPDEVLLDAALAGTLKVEANRVAQAQRMLKDAKAVAHIRRFHSEWFGYADADLSANLDQDMRAETGKLIERIVFELDEDWMKLLTWNETYVTPALAANYGLPAIAAPAWVTYGGQRGGGVISHGTFAALGAKFGDTSPTLRGYEVFKRLMCGQLGQIPAGVDTDNPPGLPGQCKVQNYTMRTNAACMGCHTITDNLGFGLENLGTTGQWRLVENGLPACTISGAGSVKSMAFNGPRELGALLAADPTVSACATKQLFRFMSGRLENAADQATLNALGAQYQQSKSFSSMILSLVKSPAIMNKGAL